MSVERFIKAQKNTYEEALASLTAKRVALINSELADSDGVNKSSLR